MTNGEKLCIDFPNMHYTLSEKQPRRVVTTIGVCASFDLDWWNTEYKNDKVDCKHTDCNNCVNHKYCDYESNKSEIPTSSDCVDRHSVDLLVYRYLKEATDNHVAFYEDFLDLPSVTPQEPIRPKGKWIPYHYGAYYECSNCHERNDSRYDKYCKFCGAEMEEVKE